MSLKEQELLKNICKYCVDKYQILNNAPILSSLIYQLCRKLEFDVPAVRGILQVDINGYKRQFAHCFNVYNGQIIDVSIYQFALTNKSIEHLFPIYIFGITPPHIEYSINSEFKYNLQFKFKDEYLTKALKEIKALGNVELKRLSLEEDCKKENIIF